MGMHIVVKGELTYNLGVMAVLHAGVMVRIALRVVCCAIVVSCSPSIRGAPEPVYSREENARFFRDNCPPNPDEVKIKEYNENGKNYRNSYILCRMLAINTNYNIYDAELTREMQSVGFGAALTNIALSSVASQVASVGAKNILSATAAGLTGAKAAYDKDILADRAVQIIQSQMRASRADVRTRIFSRLQLPLDQYPMMMALIDLQDYYEAGTFGSGLHDVRDAVGESVQIAEASANATGIYAGASASDPEVQYLRKFIFGDSEERKLNREHYEYLKELLKNKEKDPIQYYSSGINIDVRNKLIECARKYSSVRCPPNSISN